MKQYLVELFFSLEGRINRKPYIFSSFFIMSLCLLFLAVSVVFVKIFTKDIFTIYIVSNVFYLLLFIYPSFCIMSKRLHDLNNKNTLAFVCIFITLFFLIYPLTMYFLLTNYLLFSLFSILFVLILIFSTGCSLYLLCYKGTNGKNKYGKDPLKKSVPKNFYVIITYVSLIVFALYIFVEINSKNITTLISEDVMLQLKNPASLQLNINPEHLN